MNIKDSNWDELWNVYSQPPWGARFLRPWGKSFHDKPWRGLRVPHPCVLSRVLHRHVPATPLGPQTERFKGTLWSTRAALVRHSWLLCLRWFKLLGWCTERRTESLQAIISKVSHTTLPFHAVYLSCSCWNSLRTWAVSVSEAAEDQLPLLWSA